MTISANLALAYPELILAVGALALLVVGAFAPKRIALVGAGSVLVLLSAAIPRRPSRSAWRSAAA